VRSAPVVSFGVCTRWARATSTTGSRHLAPPRAHDVQGDAAVPPGRDRSHPLPQRGELQRQHVLRLDQLLRDARGRSTGARDRARGGPDVQQPDRQGPISTRK
jgi:hypothetical protein